MYNLDVLTFLLQPVDNTAFQSNSSSNSSLAEAAGAGLGEPHCLVGGRRQVQFGACGVPAACRNRNLAVRCYNSSGQSAREAAECSPVWSAFYSLSLVVVSTQKVVGKAQVVSEAAKEPRFKIVACQKHTEHKSKTSSEAAHVAAGMTKGLIFVEITLLDTVFLALGLFAATSNMHSTPPCRMGT